MTINAPKGIATAVVIFLMSAFDIPGLEQVLHKGAVQHAIGVAARNRIGVEVPVLHQDLHCGLDGVHQALLAQVRT